MYLDPKDVQSKKIGIKFLSTPTEFNCFFTSDLETI